MKGLQLLTIEVKHQETMANTKECSTIIAPPIQTPLRTNVNHRDSAKIDNERELTAHQSPHGRDQIDDLGLDAIGILW